MDPAWIALIGTVFGGAGLKLLESGLSRTNKKQDVATAMRTELRTDLTSLRKDNELLRDEVDEWRGRYYELVASVSAGDLEEARSKIKRNKET